MPAVLRFVANASPAPIIALLGRKAELMNILAKTDNSSAILQVRKRERGRRDKR
jgi:hypothetical protein